MSPLVSQTTPFDTTNQSTKIYGIAVLHKNQKTMIAGNHHHRALC